MKKLILPAFALMVLAQWIVPVKMILDSESVLTSGKVYKFKTRPIDPSDPFRGKYVTLTFDVDRFVADTLYRYQEGQEVYAKLFVDSAGYVGIADLSPDSPEEISNNVLKTKVQYIYNQGSRQVITFGFSFDRFYVEESKASNAEHAYWNAQRDSSQVTFALVKIHEGQGIIEDVMINDRKLLEIVRELNENEAQK